MRSIEKSDLEGKTIKNIQYDAVNVLVITFSDDTKLEVWADTALDTAFGSIPGFFVEED